MKYIVIAGAEDTGKTALANAILGWDFLPLLPTDLPSSCCVKDGILTLIPNHKCTGAEPADPDDTVDLAEMAKNALIKHIWGMEVLPEEELKEAIFFLLAGNHLAFPHTRKMNSRLLASDLLLTDTPGYSLTFDHVPGKTALAAAHADTVIVLLREELVEEGVDIRSLDPEWDARRDSERILVERLLKDQKSRDIYFVIPFDHGEQGDIPLEQALQLARNRFSYLSCHGEAAFFCIDPMLALIGEMEKDEIKLRASGILPLQQLLLEEASLC